MTADQITLLRPLNGQLPGKTEGEFAKPSYLWRGGAVKLDGPARLFQVLERAAQDGQWIAVRGQILPQVDATRMRRTHVNEPTLGEQAHHWLLVDLDSHRPDHKGGTPAEWAELARQDLGFPDAACWYQATSNARIKPGLRLRLAFWLDKALTNEQVKAWTASWPIDRALYTPSQPHFLAPPSLAEDPYEGEPRSGTLSGTEVHVPDDPSQEHAAQAELDTACRAVRRAPEGERRNKLNSLAFRLASKHAPDELDPEQIRVKLSEAAAGAGLGGHEAQQTLANAIRDGQAKFAQDRAGWRAKLARDQEGSLRSTAANVSLFCEHHPAFAPLAYDERSGRLVWREPAPWPYRDSESDVPSAQEWFQEHAKIDASVQAVRDGMLKASKRQRFDPVQDYLASLPAWDRTERVSTFFQRHLGVEDTQLHQAQAKCWLVQAYRRAFATEDRPVQADYTLALSGAQGLGKSSLFRALCPLPRFFRDSLPSLDKADASAAVADAWLVELAELPQRKQDRHEFKAFLTRLVDKFRRPYRRDEEICPRRCVFAITVNEPEFLSDPTGDRRHWPMLCTRRANIQEVLAERDQLWAEAKFYAERGDRAYLGDDLEAQARTQQDHFREEDPVELKVANLLGQPATGFESWLPGQLDSSRRLRWVKTLQVAELIRQDHNPRALGRVKHALRRAGWTEKRLQVGSEVARVWSRPAEQELAHVESN